MYILSYVDIQQKVRWHYLNPLCSYTNQLAHKKDHEVFNMLQKTQKYFKVLNQSDLLMISRLNLNDYDCNFLIPSSMFVRLCSILKPYKLLKIKGNFIIDWSKEINDRKLTKEGLEKKIKKIKCFQSGLKQLSFVNIKRDLYYSSNLLRLLCEYNLDSIEFLKIKYDGRVFKEESRIILEEITLNKFTSLIKLQLQNNSGFCFSNLLDFLMSEDCKLEELNLAGNNLSKELLIQLIKILPKVQSLQILNLSESIFYISVAKCFNEALPNLINLRKIVLRNCHIGSNYASYLFQGLIKNKSVEELDLQQNEVENLACGALANLIKFKVKYEKLVINLGQNGITTPGFEQIRSALIYQVQSKNTRRHELLEKMDLAEDIKIQLGGNSIFVKNFQAELEQIGQSFASIPQDLLFQEEQNINSMPMIDQTAFINDMDYEMNQHHPIMHLNNQNTTNQNENSFDGDLTQDFINDISNHQRREDHLGNDMMRIQANNQLFSPEFNANNQIQITEYNNVMTEGGQVEFSQIQMSSFNTLQQPKFDPQQQQQQYQQILQQQQHTTEYNNNNISEDDNFLDTTLITSLDFSRALQNLSNDNLADLLDFDPPEAFMKLGFHNQDNNISNSNLNDQSQLSTNSNPMHNSHNQGNNSGQNDHSSSFQRKIFKCSQLRSPKKNRRNSGHNLSAQGSGSFGHNANNASNNNEGVNDSGGGMGEDSFGTNRGSFYRTSSSFQEIFQIQKIYRDQMNFKHQTTDNMLEDIDEHMDSIIEEHEDEEEKMPPQMPPFQLKDKLDKLQRKKFSYFFKRTCFRLMIEFFKYTFNAFVKVKKVHNHLKTHMQNFIQHQFSHVVDHLMDQQQQKDFNTNLAMIVHPHRHNNSSLLNLSVSSNNSEDQSFSEMEFSVVRDTMYKYSQKAHSRFFQVPELSYLFIYFATNQKAMSRTKQRMDSKGLEYCKRIMKDIEEMKAEALIALQTQALQNNIKAMIYLNIIGSMSIQI
eukprot:403337281